MERLQRLGLVGFSSRRWRQTGKSIKMPENGISTAATRRLYSQLLERAIQSLESDPMPVRDFSSITFRDGCQASRSMPLNASGDFGAIFVRTWKKDRRANRSLSTLGPIVSRESPGKGGSMKNNFCRNVAWFVAITIATPVYAAIGNEGAHGGTVSVFCRPSPLNNFNGLYMLDFIVLMRGQNSLGSFPYPCEFAC